MTQQRDVWVREVGTRDGLQSIQTIFDTATKLEWIRLEAAAGMPEIEVGSFVPPKLLPQMADTVEVIAGAKKIPGLRVSALIPNLRGAENGMAAGADQLNYVLSVSEAHSRANVRRSVAEAIEDFGRIIEHRNAHAEYRHIRIAAGVATAFGCTISGPVALKDVLAATEALLARGADEIAVADTVGYGNPAQCRTIFREVMALAGSVPVAAHFHDTRGLGLANVDAALEVGVRRFDASLGGLGGCPYAPGAAGNVATEDVVYLFDGMQVSTGIDLGALISVNKWMSAAMGKGLPSKVGLAGLPKVLGKV